MDYDYGDVQKAVFCLSCEDGKLYYGRAAIINQLMLIKNLIQDLGEGEEQLDEISLPFKMRDVSNLLKYIDTAQLPKTFEQLDELVKVVNFTQFNDPCNYDERLGTVFFNLVDQSKYGLIREITDRHEKEKWKRQTFIIKLNRYLNFEKGYKIIQSLKTDRERQIITTIQNHILTEPSFELILEKGTRYIESLFDTYPFKKDPDYAIKYHEAKINSQIIRAWNYCKADVEGCTELI